MIETELANSQDQLIRQYEFKIEYLASENNRLQEDSIQLLLIHEQNVKKLKDINDLCKEKQEEIDKITQLMQIEVEDKLLYKKLFQEKQSEYKSLYSHTYVDKYRNDWHIIEKDIEFTNKINSIKQSAIQCQVQDLRKIIKNRNDAISKLLTENRSLKESLLDATSEYHQLFYQLKQENIKLEFQIKNKKTFQNKFHQKGEEINFYLTERVKNLTEELKLANEMIQFLKISLNDKNKESKSNISTPMSPQTQEIASDSEYLKQYDELNKILKENHDLKRKISEYEFFIGKVQAEGADFIQSKEQIKFLAQKTKELKLKDEIVFNISESNQRLEDELQESRSIAQKLQIKLQKNIKEATQKSLKNEAILVKFSQVFKIMNPYFDIYKYDQLNLTEEEQAALSNASANNDLKIKDLNSKIANQESEIQKIKFEFEQLQAELKVEQSAHLRMSNKFEELRLMYQKNEKISELLKNQSPRFIKDRPFIKNAPITQQNKEIDLIANSINAYNNETEYEKASLKRGKQNQNKDFIREENEEENIEQQSLAEQHSLINYIPSFKNQSEMRVFNQQHAEYKCKMLEISLKEFQEDRLSLLQIIRQKEIELVSAYQQIEFLRSAQNFNFINVNQQKNDYLKLNEEKIQIIQQQTSSQTNYLQQIEELRSQLSKTLEFNMKSNQLTISEYESKIISLNARIQILLNQNMQLISQKQAIKDKYNQQKLRNPQSILTQEERETQKNLDNMEIESNQVRMPENHNIDLFRNESNLIGQATIQNLTDILKKNQSQIGKVMLLYENIYQNYQKLIASYEKKNQDAIYSKEDLQNMKFYFQNIKSNLQQKEQNQVILKNRLQQSLNEGKILKEGYERDIFELRNNLTASQKRQTLLIDELSSIKSNLIVQSNVQNAMKDESGESLRTAFLMINAKNCEISKLQKTIDDLQKKITELQEQIQEEKKKKGQRESPLQNAEAIELRKVLTEQNLPQILKMALEALSQSK